QLSSSRPSWGRQVFTPHKNCRHNRSGPPFPHVRSHRFCGQRHFSSACLAHALHLDGASQEVGRRWKHSDLSCEAIAMAFLPTKDAEPIHGYRLVEKIGSGGFGEVWRATAPGELTKAIKIVFGDVAGPRAEQELRALRRIKEVRHPFLLSLERFEILEGQLL